MRRRPRSEKRDSHAGRNRKRRRTLAIERLEGRIVLDAAGPIILSHNPSEIRNEVFDHIELVFDSPIDASTVSAHDVTISGPGGVVAVTAVELLDAARLQVRFDPLAKRGHYADVILSHELTISAGDEFYENRDVLIDGSTMAIDGDHAFRSLHLVNGAVLTHTANSASDVYSLELTILNELIVSADSRIDVSEY